MFSWGELAVIIGAGACLYGPKDLPRAARQAGKMVGQCVIFMKQARSGADSFAKEHELLQLHQDVRKSLMELNEIRADIQQAGSIMPPRMYAQVPMNFQRPTAFPLTMPQQHHLSHPQPAAPYTASPTSSTASNTADAPPLLEHLQHLQHLQHLPSIPGVMAQSPPAGRGSGLRVEEASAPYVTYGAPSSEAAIMFSPKTDQAAGGADHIMELLFLRERMQVTAMGNGARSDSRTNGA